MTFFLQKYSNVISGGNRCDIGALTPDAERIAGAGRRGSRQAWLIYKIHVEHAERNGGTLLASQEGTNLIHELLIRRTRDRDLQVDNKLT